MQKTIEKIEPVGHSPLGMSSMKRIMECPASAGLGYAIDEDEEDDTYSKPGTAAHALAELCLRESIMPWTKIGTEPGVGISFPDGSEVFVDKEMADAIQLYLDDIDTAHPDRNQGNTWVERKFYCPTIHKYFWGTADLVHIDGRTLHVWDLKYGAGIVVEVDENPQVMGYGCGVLEDLQLWGDVDEVVFHIHQPRVPWHYDGVHRTWSCSTADLEDWLWDKLVPAMDKSLVSRDTKSGEHCRFCPARYRACPQLVKDMKELEAMIKEFEGKTAEAFTSPELSRMLKLIAVAKIVGKAAEQTAFKRLQNGKEVPGYKLGNAKVNREFKEGAEAEAKEVFGAKAAYTTPKLKSPAQISALPKGEEFVARWAFKPDAGLTLIPDTDSRPAVNKSTKSLFQPVKKRGKAG